jgi:hypothetical protein
MLSQRLARLCPRWINSADFSLPCTFFQAEYVKVEINIIEIADSNFIVFSGMMRICILSCASIGWGYDDSTYEIGYLVWRWSRIQLGYCGYTCTLVLNTPFIFRVALFIAYYTYFCMVSFECNLGSVW